MRRALVALALIAACRGESRPNEKPARGAPSEVPTRVSIVPELPKSEPGDAVMRGLDAEIDRVAGEKNDVALVELLLQRASIRGWLEDYSRALSVARTAVEKQPTDQGALAALARAQLAVHLFAEARVTIAKLGLGSAARDELQTSLDQATGNLDATLAARKKRVELFADAASVTLLAATLAEAGKPRDGIALIDMAVKQLRSNTPQYFAWLLFQWGLLYEQSGETAAARDFYAEAHRRLPVHVEVTTHLIEALGSLGDLRGARALLEATATDTPRHPAYLALAASMSGTNENIKAASEAWERYIAAFPAAFADHAARFYMGAGNNSKRALELAQINLDARDTPAARGLVIDAALSEGDKERACGAIGPLATSGPRRERFLAWRAFTACGRKSDAERLASELGIQPH